MAVICVPYHLDDYLPDLPSVLPADGDVTTLIAELPDSDIWTRLRRLFEEVAGRVKESHRTTSVAKVVSGDCMTSLGTMAGLQRAGVNPGIVWFDAHGDVQTLETSASGYLGGLPLRVLVGYRPELVAARLGLHAVDEERVVLVGARDLDPPEVEYLEQSDIRRCGVEELSAEILPAGPPRGRSQPGP